MSSGEVVVGGDDDAVLVPSWLENVAYSFGMHEDFML